MMNEKVHRVLGIIKKHIKEVMEKISCIKLKKIHLHTYLLSIWMNIKLSCVDLNTLLAGKGPIKT